MEVNEFLEEIKSMMEISEYHDNIVNLQGMTYKTASKLARQDGEGTPRIDVSYFNTNYIVLKKDYYSVRSDYGF